MGGEREGGLRPAFFTFFCGMEETNIVSLWYLAQSTQEKELYETWED